MNTKELQNKNELVRYIERHGLLGYCVTQKYEMTYLYRERTCSIC